MNGADTTGAMHMAETEIPMRAAGGGLVYLMGASGSGKDTLLRLARLRLLEADGIVIARRVITRSSSADEPSLEVSEAQFMQMSEAGRFAMQWRSHGLHYGIDVEVDERLAHGQVVIVNGSRRYLPHALARYPAMSVVEITVDPVLLAERLRSRGRETPEQIAQRLSQAVLATPSVLPPGVLHQLPNHATPEEAAEGLLRIARKLVAQA